MKKFLLYSLLSIVILLIGGFLYITLTPPASPLDTSIFKEDGKEVKSGTECGIGVKDYNDIKSGDQMEVYKRTEIKRSI